MTNMDRIAEIRKRAENAKDIGLTGAHMAAAVFDAYCDDIPYLLSQLAERDKEIERLREAQRWVPVTDRLPERNERILGYTPSKPGFSELYEVTRGFMAMLGKRTGITHWMPLPDPPQKGD